MQATKDDFDVILLLTSFTQAESFVSISWLIHGREGHVGMYSAGLVVLQLWKTFSAVLKNFVENLNFEEKKKIQ